MAIELRSDKYPKKFQNSKFLSQQIQKKIEALGGEMANSVEKETTALVSDPGANTILFLSELLHWFAILNIPFSKMVCYPLFISWLVCTVQIEEVKCFFVCAYEETLKEERSKVRDAKKNGVVVVGQEFLSGIKAEGVNAMLKQVLLRIILVVM